VSISLAAADAETMVEFASVGMLDKAPQSIRSRLTPSPELRGSEPSKLLTAAPIILFKLFY